MQHFPCCERTQHEYLIHRVGSLPSFAAQSTNGRNAENRPFAALVANVSVADRADLCSCGYCFRRIILHSQKLAYCSTVD
ncbi:MAG: hypothetical protein WBV62_14170, partial [Roseobacter sp.]